MSTDYAELDRLLDVAVRETTGIPTAAARPAQRLISRRMWDVLSTARERPTFSHEEGDGFPPAEQVALEAPTGSGKGLAYLSPAVLAACESGRRTVVSTESIALQTQLVAKDFPSVARAAMALYGKEVRVAVHKGWSNYVCLASAAYAAAELTEEPAEVRNRLHSASATDLAALGSRVAAKDPLLGWALGQPATGGDGDKASCTVEDAAKRWDDVSTDPDACLAKSCPLYELCLPEQARMRAAAADVVVTNHSILAVQAAKAVPVIIGNSKLGDIDAVVIDEAHTLPSQVRSTGATMITGRSITSVQRSLEILLEGSSHAALARSAKAATALSAAVNAEITACIESSAETKIDRDRDPLKRNGDIINAWVAAARQLIRPMTASGHGPTVLRAQAVNRRLQALSDATRDVREGGLGVARWVSPGRDADRAGTVWAELHASPVEVGPLLADQVFAAPVVLDEENKHGADEVDGRVPRYALPVVTCSATMPTTFTAEAGLHCDMEQFESPFADAYANCMLYVPRPISLPTKQWNGRGRPSLDTAAHPAWALEHMKALVETNGGRALVLSATAGAGRGYADALRAHARGRWKVIDAWSTPREQAVTAWRADETAVLVGTRGLMTGVDAAGDTCSLVIVDRIPRAANNPVDDARVELAATKVGKWKADEVVYVADAAALLEQAAGRLVRSAGDRGMVAVLDPRLLKGDLAYRESVRQAYLGALGHFVRMTASKDQAVAFLTELRTIRRQQGQLAA